jgi:DnaJ-domain-containing protein 1
MREQGARHAGEAVPDAPNPWQEERAALARLSETPSPVSDDEAERAERYNEWAERLRAKRRRLTDDLEGSPAPSNWSTDALFEESRRVEDDELHSAHKPNPWRVQELLAVLDLREGATAAEVGMAYRRLAKVHHPDRFVEADLDVQEFHAHKMREIIRAYRTLKDLDRGPTT